MNVLCYGEIMDGGVSVFHCIASEDEGSFTLTLAGVVRIDNPYRHLKELLETLPGTLHARPLSSAVLDFSKLEFCNSNGFYVIMDIVEIVYASVPGPVLVRRLQEDDWQQETLPILLNLDEESIAARTTFEDVREL